MSVTSVSASKVSMSVSSGLFRRKMGLPTDSTVFSWVPRLVSNWLF